MAAKTKNEVYGLYCTCGCEPGERIRYVGQSSLGARDRLNKHRYSARNDHPWPVCRWMRKHGPDNIQVRVLEEFADSSEMDEAEKSWIQRLHTDISEGGYNLMPGGKSIRGYKHAPDAKSRIPRKHSEETRRRISEALTGRNGENAGHVTITEVQAKEIIRLFWEGHTIRGIAQITGIPSTTVVGITSCGAWAHLPRPEKPRKIVSTGRFKAGELPMSTKLNEDDVRQIRLRSEAGTHRKELAVEYGVTPENITMIVQRKTWKHVE